MFLAVHVGPKPPLLFSRPQRSNDQVVPVTDALRNEPIACSTQLRFRRAYLIVPSSTRRPRASGASGDIESSHPPTSVLAPSKATSP